MATNVKNADLAESTNPDCRRKKYYCKTRKKLEQYRYILKGKTRRSGPQVKKAAEFQASLCELFDIAHIDALQLIKIPDDQEFLNAQREPRRRGFMAGIDKVLEQKIREFQRHELSKQRAKREMQNKAVRNETVELTSSDSNTDTAENSDSDISSI